MPHPPSNAALRPGASASSPTFDVGLVGCGAWGRHILRDLVDLGARVHVVARSEASVARAEAGQATSVVGEIGALPRCAGIVVSTPTSTHAAVLDEVLTLGVPVYCEKALTDDPVAAAVLAERAPGSLFVMDKWRYHPGVVALGEIARAGRLGDVVGVESVRIGWGNPHGDVDGVWILLPHDLSIALEVLGRVPEPVAAVGDHAGGFPTGLTGIFRADDVWVHAAVSTRSPVRRRAVRVLGTEAIAELGDAYDDAVLVHPATDPADTRVPEPERLTVGSDMPLRAELAAFLTHLAGGPPPKSSAAEGAAIVDAVARARALAGLDPARSARR